jgi:hypothetical protein
MAPGVGIEPTIAESKSVVLPLHYPGTNKTGYVFYDRLGAYCSTAERFFHQEKVGIEPTCHK